MTSAQIKDIFGVAQSKTTASGFLPGLRTILMTTNQGISFREDYLDFDFEKETLKIKKYRAFPMSARLTNLRDQSPEGYEKTILRYDFDTRMVYSLKKYPKVNDQLTIYNKQTKQDENYTIVSSVGSLIETDKAIENVKNKIDDPNYVFYYTDGQYLADSEKDLVDPCLYVYRKPLSKHKFDVMLDTKYILGFELISERIGND